MFASVETKPCLPFHDFERMGLPSRIGELQIYQKPKKDEKLYAVVRQKENAYDFSVVNEKGEYFLDLKGYETAEFMGGIDKDLVAPLKAVPV